MLILQVIKVLNEEEKKIENLVRLGILSMNVFNFILFMQSNSNSAVSDLKYHSHEHLNFSEMKTVDDVVIASTCRSCILSIYTIN